jgi:hypothetical protein
MSVLCALCAEERRRMWLILCSLGLYTHGCLIAVALETLTLSPIMFMRRDI